MFNLNPNRFAEAEKFYKDFYFQPIAVPWAVSREAIAITAPPNVEQTAIEKDKLLVGSAEQSFLQMIIDNVLPAGRYQALTPCFRREAVQDDLHLPYFVKLELIETQNTDEENLLEIIEICKKWFSQFLRVDSIYVRPEPWDSVTLGKCFDIISKECGTELGSYGMRFHPKVGTWIYATGCAEPRLTTVLKKLKRDHLR